MSTQKDILKLYHQLLPKGRAFELPNALDGDTLLRVLARGQARAWNDMVGLLDSILPDNDNFTADDATDWERRLGIPTGTGVSLADRKLAIIRKINHPGTIKPRQNYRYLQGQLQAAGFDVYVYENIFDDGGGGTETRTPGVVLDEAAGQANLGGFNLGELNLGSVYADNGVTLAVNYLEESKDANWGMAANLRNTFYIAGATIDTFAEVDAARKTEFRQLILLLKPLHLGAFLFVNYV